MAATFWVDGTQADDTGNGLTYLTAKKTISAGATLIDGSAETDITLNVVNSTSYEMDTTYNNVDFDCDASTDVVIRGTDSSGTPALTTVTSPNSASACFFLGVRTVNTCIFEYLDVDWSASIGQSTTQAFIGVSENGDHGSVKARYCQFTGSALGGALPSGDRNLVSFQSTRNDVITAEFCVFTNMWGGTVLTNAGAAAARTDFNNCVLIVDTTDEVSDNFILHGGVGDATDDILRFHQCTVSVDQIATTALGAFIKATWLANAAAELSVHDNVFWVADSGGFDATLTTLFETGNAGSIATATINTVGYNVFYTDSDYPDGDVTAYYRWAPFSPDAGKAYSTDTVVNSTTATALFADPSSPYSWTPAGSAVALTVPQDLRLVAELTSGTAGARPGALPAGTTDYTVVVSSDVSSPAPGDSVALAVRVSNSGSNATGVEVAAAVPAGLTLVSTSASAGSWAAGVWSVGTLNDAASETLTINCTVDADQAGESISFTATWQDGSPGTDTSTSDDTDTLTLSVIDTSDIGDTGNPATAPYLDTFPIYATDLKLDVNVQLTTERNRVTRNVLRGDIEGQRWREGSFRRINLGTNTTTQLIMGGIQRGKIIMLESTVQIDVSVGNSTNTYWPVKTLVLGSGDFEKLYLRNTSTTVSATVLYGVSD